MKGKYFIDTNIFVYAFDTTAPKKRDKANSIIKSALLERQGCISSQVIQEFINVATKKFIVPLSIKDCEKFLQSVLTPLCEVYANIDLYHRALDIMENRHFSFYDSLIIAAAVQAECAVLYSEDLQHQQKIQSLTIINPFFRD